jgi:type II secretory pathway component PulM
MNFADGVTAKPGAAGSDKKSDQQLHTILENLGRVAHQDDLHSGFTSRLDLEALERKAIYDRLVAIESQMKRRGSGGFARYLVGILVGVATTLAWQSWTKPLAGHENTAVQPSALETPQAATVPQTAPETVAAKAPPAPSLDPTQVQQITQSLAAVRETLQELGGGQDSMARDIARLESAVAEILLKIPEPPPPPPTAPTRKPPTSPSSSRAPTAPPSSRALMPPRQ